MSIHQYLVLSLFLAVAHVSVKTNLNHLYTYSKNYNVLSTNEHSLDICPIVLDTFPSSRIFLSQGAAISDYNSTFMVDSIPIDISNLPNRIDANFGLSKVCINITHPRVSDLKVELLSPDGTSIWLTNRNGGDDGSGYVNTCFRSNGFNGYIHQSNAPFTGEYIPDGRFDFINNGQNPNGTWYILIRDSKKNKTGNIHLISMEFDKNPMPGIHASPCSFATYESCSCKKKCKKNCELLPDLIILEKFTQSQIKEYPWNDQEYPGQLRFAATIANIGYGPLETIGKNEWTCGDLKVDSSHICADGSRPRQLLYQRIYSLAKNGLSYKDIIAGSNYFDDQPGHDHFHVDNWLEYRLKKEIIDKNGQTKYELITKANKVSYCLFDSGACNNQYRLCTYGDQQYDQHNLKNYGLGNYTSCNAKKQGISVGGYDTYGMHYEGQYLQLPSFLTPGIYILEIEIDPDNLYKEESRKNNIFSMSIELNKQKH